MAFVLPWRDLGFRRSGRSDTYKRAKIEKSNSPQYVISRTKTIKITNPINRKKIIKVLQNVRNSFEGFTPRVYQDILMHLIPVCSSQTLYSLIIKFVKASDSL